MRGGPSSLDKRRDKIRMMSEMRQQERDINILRQDEALVNKAEAEYLQEQEEKNKRQEAKGLGLLVVAVPNESEEESARKKRSQGLGAAISSGNSTLG